VEKLGLMMAGIGADGKPLAAHEPATEQARA
jgi:hypothetical protein